MFATAPVFDANWIPTTSWSMLPGGGDQRLVIGAVDCSGQGIHFVPWERDKAIRLQSDMRSQTTFAGIITPLITPIFPDESPDLVSLKRLVRFQLDAGVHGLWVMGTSGEFASFDEDTRAAVAECVIAEVDNSVPVVVNASDASTGRALRHARHAHSLGADAVAVTPPYYYPHSQDEVLAHFSRVRDVVDLPLFIYNIPQTVRVRVELATARTLAYEGIASGIKDSQNDLEWFRQLTLFASREAPAFVAFAGTRSLVDAAMLCGAAGAIPSIANAFPHLCVEAFGAAIRHEPAAARAAAEYVIDIESVSSDLTAGSRNAAVLGLLKTILAFRKTIQYANLTAPLRTPNLAEQAQLYERVLALDVGTDSVPVESGTSGS